jgi:hypothetical protein
MMSMNHCRDLCAVSHMSMDVSDERCVYGHGAVAVSFKWGRRERQWYTPDDTSHRSRFVCGCIEPGRFFFVAKLKLDSPLFPLPRPHRTNEMRPEEIFYLLWPVDGDLVRLHQFSLRV